MDDQSKTAPPPIDEKDADLPVVPLVLPPDEPAPVEPPIPPAEVPPAEAGPTEPQTTEPAEPEIVPEAPVIVVPPEKVPDGAPPPTEHLALLEYRMQHLKDDGITWFKEHKAIGVVMGLMMFGFLLYFWPLIGCALAAQHMLKNTKGTANKAQMYKVVGILAIIAISIQAIWIVQLAQATTGVR